jgi:adenosylhomocysteine nucleosidase
MPELAIVAALEREIRPLVRNWRVEEQEYSGRRFRFFVGSERCVAVCGGTGTEAARRATEAVIALYHPSKVESVGFAGALVAGLKVGQVLAVRSVIDARDNSRKETGAGEAVLVSFSSVAGEEQKTKLTCSYGAQVVDMEAAGVAKSAEAHGIDFGAIKVVSDELGFPMVPMESFIDGAGAFHTGDFVMHAILRPWLWGRLLRLALNSSQAAHSLSEYLEARIEGSVPARTQAGR